MYNVENLVIFSYFFILLKNIYNTFLITILIFKCKIEITYWLSSYIKLLRNEL